MSQHDAVPKGYLRLWGDADNIPEGWSVEEWPEHIDQDKIKIMVSGDPPTVPLVDENGNLLSVLIKKD